MNARIAAADWRPIRNIIVDAMDRTGVTYLDLEIALLNNNVKGTKSTIQRMVEDGTGFSKPSHRLQVLRVMEKALDLHNGQLVDPYLALRAAVEAVEPPERLVRTSEIAMNLVIETGHATMDERLLVEALADNPEEYLAWSTVLDVEFSAVAGCELVSSAQVGPSTVEARFRLPRMRAGESDTIKIRRTYPEGYPGEIYTNTFQYYVDAQELEVYLPSTGLPAKYWDIAGVRSHQRQVVDTWLPKGEVSPSGHLRVSHTALKPGFTYGAAWWPIR